MIFCYALNRTWSQESCTCVCQGIGKRRSWSIVLTSEDLFHAVSASIVEEVDAGLWMLVEQLKFQNRRLIVENKSLKKAQCDQLPDSTRRSVRAISSEQTRLPSPFAWWLIGPTKITPILRIVFQAVVVKKFCLMVCIHFVIISPKLACPGIAAGHSNHFCQGCIFIQSHAMVKQVLKVLDT